MALQSDLSDEVTNIFRQRWHIRDGQVVPQADDLALQNNSGVRLEATCLYADIVGLTSLVNRKRASFAADVYKAFLFSTSRIIREYRGEIRSFDGDRVMAVFIGGSKNTNAVRSALKIAAAVQEIINPTILDRYPNTDFELQHVVGIDTSELLVTRNGIRGSNDLVWIGRAANHAAKLCEIREDRYSTWITRDVYRKLSPEVKFNGETNMWETLPWDEQDGQSIYGSQWYWSL